MSANSFLEGSEICDVMHMIILGQVLFYLRELTERIAQGDGIQILKASQAKLKVKDCSMLVKITYFTTCFVASSFLSERLHLRILIFADIRCGTLLPEIHFVL